MKIIDAKQINELVIQKVSDFYENRQAKVVIINASNDEASEVYCDKKQQAFEKVGVECLVLDLDEETVTEDVIHEIEMLNQDPTVIGIMVQHPVYESVDFKTCMLAIDPTKDIDGLHPMNQGIPNYKTETIIPATAHGVEMLIAHAGYSVKGKVVCIVGRGFLVADVLAKILENQGATVVKIHTQTDNIDKKWILEQADMIISCAGKDLSVDLNPQECPNCEMLVGVGFRYENGKQIQDFNIEDWEGYNVIVTNRIGGTGLATISALLVNSVMCCMMQEEQNKLVGGTK